MWIYLNNAVISVVERKDHQNELLVRSRYKGHLEKIFPEVVLSEMEEGIFVDELADYQYRIYIDKGVFSRLVADGVAAIDYSSYQKSVEVNTPSMLPLLARIKMANMAHSYDKLGSGLKKPIVV